MLRIDLPRSVTDDLYATFARLPAPAGLTGDVDTLLARLLQACAVLPAEVVAQLLAFRAAPSAPSSVLISGLPVDADLPPTPTDSAGRPAKPGSVSECAILAVAVLLGEPMAYRAEKDGALVQDVFPTRAHRDTPSNESSAASLGFHTELTFSRSFPDRPLHAASPDFVLLLGLRCPADRSATTSVVDLRAVCERLDPQHVAALREPQYELMAPYSFTRDDDSSRPWSAPVALLRGPDQAPSMAFDTACGVRALTPDADKAVAALSDACQDPQLREDVQLRPGDLLAVNNNRAAHSRSSFPAWFDGCDRWLQRVYVRRSIWPLSVEATNDRVLT
jgi:L-asparagine oxygenase